MRGSGRSAWASHGNRQPSFSCCDAFRFVVDADTLTIKDVTDRDKGTYTCIMNTTLDHDSASAVLTVVGRFTAQLAGILSGLEPMKYLSFLRLP